MDISTKRTNGLNPQIYIFSASGVRWYKGEVDFEIMLVIFVLYHSSHHSCPCTCGLVFINQGQEEKIKDHRSSLFKEGTKDLRKRERKYKSNTTIHLVRLHILVRPLYEPHLINF